MSDNKCCERTYECAVLLICPYSLFTQDALLTYHGKYRLQAKAA